MTEDQAKALDEKILELYLAGHYREALPLALRLEKFWPSEHPASAYTLETLAQIYQGLGEYNRALDLYKKALKIHKKYSSDKIAPLTTAICLHNLGSLYFEMGDYDRALDRFNDSLRIKEKSNLFPPSIAKTLNKLASVYRDMGLYDKAMPRYQQARKIIEDYEGTEHIDIANILDGMAQLDVKVGNYDQALDLYEQALKIKKKELGLENPDTATTLGNLANFYQEMGLYDKALTFRQQSLKITEKVLGTEHPQTATDLNNLAVLYYAMGSYEKGLSLQKQALQIREKTLSPKHPSIANTLTNLGYFYLARKDWGQAESYFKKGNCDIGLAEIDLERNQFKRALQLLDGMDPGRKNSVDFFIIKGLALAGDDQRKYAATTLFKAVEEIEYLRNNVPVARTGFLQGENIRPYRGLVEVLAKMNEKGESLPDILEIFGPVKEVKEAAFYYAEATKARVMLEGMAQRAIGRVEAPEELRHRYEALQYQLAANDVQLEKAFQSGSKELQQKVEIKRQELQAQLQALIPKLRKSSRLYAALFSPNPLASKEIPLRKNEVLLEYALGEKAGYVFLLRQGGIQDIFPIPLGKEALEGKVKVFMEPLLNGRIGGYSLEEGKRLYELLLAQPLAGVREDERIVIVPDGTLGLLPFEALVKEEGQGVSNSVFVGDKHTITYYQSGMLLALQRLQPQEQAKYPLFALGNPFYNSKDPRYQAYRQGKPAPQLSAQDQAQFGFEAQATTKVWGKTIASDTEGKKSYYPPLPETEDEVKELAHLWGVEPIPPNVLLGVWANKTQLRKAHLEDYRYLHFATHADLGGQVQGINEPFILLGQVENKGKDKGFLTLSDVLKLKLNADIVVLSACLTGRGKVMEGEGVMNLTRAFQYAGARSLLVSLWNVKSKIAVEFMKTFYGQLQEPGVDKVTALRRARDKIKQDKNIVGGSNPLLWAVFILYGEG